MEEMQYPASFAISRFGEANYSSKIKKHFLSSRQILRKCNAVQKKEEKKDAGRLASSADLSYYSTFKLEEKKI